MGHANTPPELPEVTDEAGDSPWWLPWFGVVFFVVGGVWIGYCHHSSSAADSVSDAAEP